MLRGRKYTTCWVAKRVVYEAKRLQDLNKTETRREGVSAGDLSAQEKKVGGQDVFFLWKCLPVMLFMYLCKTNRLKTEWLRDGCFMFDEPLLEHLKT